MRAESNYDQRAKIMIGLRPPFRKSGEILLLHARNNGWVMDGMDIGPMPIQRFTMDTVTDQTSRAERGYEILEDITRNHLPIVCNCMEQFISVCKSSALEILLEIGSYLLNRGEVGASGWPPQGHERCEQVPIRFMRRHIVLLEKVTSLSECSIHVSNNPILREQMDVTFSGGRNEASDQRSSISALADATPDHDLHRMRFLLREKSGI
jgi:hypothetical protein